MAATEKITALLERKRAYEEMAKTDGEAAIRELLTEFFAANPKIGAVKWRQYTPYFNDGDACVFSVREIDQVKLIGELPEGAEPPEDEDDGDWTDAYSLDKITRAGVQDLSHTLGGLSDVLQVVFEDHAEITATRENIRVDQYDHD